MWHSYIFRKCCKFWHHTPLSCQKRCSKIQKIWHQNEAPYALRNFTHMCIALVYRIALLLHLLHVYCTRVFSSHLLHHGEPLTLKHTGIATCATSTLLHHSVPLTLQGTGIAPFFFTTENHQQYHNTTVPQHHGLLTKSTRWLLSGRSIKHKVSSMLIRYKMHWP